MLTITDGGSLSRALSSSIHTRLKSLLTERVRQLDVEDLSTAARFVIVQPGDTGEALEQALSFSVLQNPADGTRFGDPDFSPGWEWLASHLFGYELTFEGTTDSPLGPCSTALCSQPDNEVSSCVKVGTRSVVNDMDVQPNSFCSTGTGGSARLGDDFRFATTLLSGLWHRRCCFLGGSRCLFGGATLLSQSDRLRHRPARFRVVRRHHRIVGF